MNGLCYANIFIGDLERKISAQVDKRPDIWWRYMYIDDIFIIWPHDQERLTEFIEQLNNVHSKIQFTAKWSNRYIAFLDVKVSIQDGRFTTDLFTKPTVCMHQYLCEYSCPLARCKSTIVYSQVLHLRWICSNGETYLRRLEELKEYLVHQGYKREEVQQQNDRTTNVTRTEALTMSEIKNVERTH